MSDEATTPQPAPTKTKPLDVLRGLVWLIIPISILVGDIFIRWRGDLAEQLNRDNWSNLPTAFLLSCGLWFALTILIGELRRREQIIVGAIVAGVGALAVVGIWQYNLVIHHDPNPGVIVYSLHEPANARKLAESGVTFGYSLALLVITALWTAAMFFTRIEATRLIRISSAVMVVGFVAATLGWHDPSPDRESPYVSDVYFGVLVGTAIKRMVSYGNESALSDAERVEVTAIEPPGEVPNVLFFVGESLRRDRMSLYGAKRKTTPFIDEWVAEHQDGFVDFPHAWSASAFTPISLASFLTGLYPARTRDEFHTSPVLWQWAHALGGSSYVYATQMWTWSNLSLFFLSGDPPTYWATADEMEAPIVNDTGIDDRIAARTFARALAENPPGEKPAFMLYQTNATHYPLLPHEDPGFAVKSRPDQYDAAIRVVDDSFEIVVEGLEAAGVADDTIIVFMADHGEFNWDLYESKVEGREIATDLIDGERIESCHPTLAKIPFFVWVPPKWRDRLGGRFETLQANADRTVSLVDVFPTTLDLWGQSVDAAKDGRSLLQPIPDDRWVACFTNTPWARWLMNGYAVIDGDRFLYQREDFTEPQAFDARSGDEIRYQLRGVPLSDEDRSALDARRDASELLGRYDEYLRQTRRE